jgi:hypothetical protein
MTNRNKYKSDLAFIDLFANVALAMAALAMMFFILIKVDEPKQKKGIEHKAEALITMTWPDESLDDMDLWLLLPDNAVVNYMNKDNPAVSLDRDDRGGDGDIVGKGDDMRLIKINKEVMSIRALLPGKYYANVHVFRKNDSVEKFIATVKMPYPVKVTLTKLNPVVIDLVSKEVIMSRVGEQHTAFSFQVDENGNIFGFDTTEENPFAHKDYSPSPGAYDGLDGPLPSVYP